MTLHVRQLAWLHAVPKRGGADRLGDEGARVSRLEEMERDDVEPYLPETPCEELVGWLFDAGPVGSSGMGPMKLSHAELQAWQENTGIRAQPWQIRALRSLSAAYIKESRRAEDPAALSPCHEDDVVYRGTFLPNRIRGVLRG